MHICLTRLKIGSSANSEDAYKDRGDVVGCRSLFCDSNGRRIKRYIL